MSIHMINGNKAHAYYEHERAFWGCPPWIAIWDGYDGAPIDHETPSSCPIGLGDSEQEALDDLLEQSDD